MSEEIAIENSRKFTSCVDADASLHGDNSGDTGLDEAGAETVKGVVVVGCGCLTAAEKDKAKLAGILGLASDHASEFLLGVGRGRAVGLFKIDDTLFADDLAVADEVKNGEAKLHLLFDAGQGHRALHSDQLDVRTTIENLTDNFRFSLYLDRRKAIIFEIAGIGDDNENPERILFQRCAGIPLACDLAREVCRFHRGEIEWITLVSRVADGFPREQMEFWGFAVDAETNAPLRVSPLNLGPSQF